METNWILRVGDGKNLIRSSPHNIWGINSKTSCGKYFMKNAKAGDRLWFVKSKSKGKVLAVATLVEKKKREIGELVNLSLTNEELGWDNEDTDWTSDTEVHYTNLYNVSNCELLTYINGPSTIRLYNDKCKVVLATEYVNICRYSKVTFNL
jgi:hypothetical protein